MNIFKKFDPKNIVKNHTPLSNKFSEQITGKYNLIRTKGGLINLILARLNKKRICGKNTVSYSTGSINNFYEFNLSFHFELTKPLIPASTFKLFSDNSPHTSYNIKTENRLFQKIRNSENTRFIFNKYLIERVIYRKFFIPFSYAKASKTILSSANPGAIRIAKVDNYSLISKSTVHPVTKMDRSNPDKPQNKHSLGLSSAKLRVINNGLFPFPIGMSSNFSYPISSNFSYISPKIILSSTNPEAVRIVKVDNYSLISKSTIYPVIEMDRSNPDKPQNKYSLELSSAKLRVINNGLFPFPIGMSSNFSYPTSFNFSFISPKIILSSTNPEAVRIVKVDNYSQISKSTIHPFTEMDRSNPDKPQNKHSSELSSAKLQVINNGLFPFPIGMSSNFSYPISSNFSFISPKIILSSTNSGAVRIVKVDNYSLISKSTIHPVTEMDRSYPKNIDILQTKVKTENIYPISDKNEKLQANFLFSSRKTNIFIPTSNFNTNVQAVTQIYPINENNKLLQIKFANSKNIHMVENIQNFSSFFSGSPKMVSHSGNPINYNFMNRRINVLKNGSNFNKTYNIPSYQNENSTKIHITYPEHIMTLKNITLFNKDMKNRTSELEIYNAITHKLTELSTELILKKDKKQNVDDTVNTEKSYTDNSNSTKDHVNFVKKSHSEMSINEMDDIADSVYKIIERKISIEKDRRGLF